MTDRQKHWEDVYAKHPPGQVSWYQEEPALSLQLIRGLHLRFDAPIIDVGGGASTLVDNLCDDGYTNVGVLDLSARALRFSKKRLAEKAGSVAWYVEDVTEFKPPHQFSLWHDRAVFHFLTSPEDRARYRSTLNQALETGGHLIMMAFAIDGPKKCSGLDIVQYDADTLTTELGPGFDLLETGHETHITPSARQQRFAYFHLRKK